MDMDMGPGRMGTGRRIMGMLIIITWSRRRLQTSCVPSIGGRRPDLCIPRRMEGNSSSEVEIRRCYGRLECFQIVDARGMYISTASLCLLIIPGTHRLTLPATV